MLSVQLIQVARLEKMPHALPVLLHLDSACTTAYGLNVNILVRHAHTGCQLMPKAMINGQLQDAANSSRGVHLPEPRGTEHPAHAVLSAVGCWQSASGQQAWVTALATLEAWCTPAQHNAHQHCSAGDGVLIRMHLISMMLIGDVPEIDSFESCVQPFR